nr:hypothetical protein [Tanacetum cinerariifolium]
MGWVGYLLWDGGIRECRVALLYNTVMMHRIRRYKGSGLFVNGLGVWENTSRDRSIEAFIIGDIRSWCCNSSHIRYGSIANGSSGYGVFRIILKVQVLVYGNATLSLSLIKVSGWIALFSGHYALWFMWVIWHQWAYIHRKLPPLTSKGSCYGKTSGSMGNYDSVDYSLAWSIMSVKDNAEFVYKGYDVSASKFKRSKKDSSGHHDLVVSKVWLSMLKENKLSKKDIKRNEWEMSHAMICFQVKVFLGGDLVSSDLISSSHLFPLIQVQEKNTRIRQETKC